MNRNMTNEEEKIQDVYSAYDCFTRFASWCTLLHAKDLEKLQSWIEGCKEHNNDNLNALIDAATNYIATEMEGL